MKLLTLSRTNSGNYSIIDNNDEKLLIVAETLIHAQLRSQLKELLAGLPTLVDSYRLLSPETAKIKYSILKETSDFVLIRVHNTEQPVSESNPLQIDMNCETYLDLIEDWEDLEAEKPDQIFLKRVEDVFILTSNPANL